MFLFPPVADSAVKLLDAASAAHSAMGSFHAHVILDAKVGGHRQQSTYDLSVNGQNVLLRLQQPRKAGEDRSDRTFYFTPGKVVAYDAMADERVARTVPKTGARLERVEFLLGALPDMMRNLLEPKDMRTFLASMQNLPGWSVIRKSDRVVLSRPGARGAKPAIIVFGVKRPLIQRLDAGSPGNEIHWSFAYGPAGRVAFTPPSSARPVSAFTVAPEPPHYASKQAERITKGMLDAYARLSSGVIDIDVDGNASHVRIALSGRKLREDTARVAYAYDGQILYALNKRTKAFYRGQAIRSTVPDLVADIAGGTDSLSRQFLQRRIPFREAIRPNMKVSTGGEITTPSGPCDILSLEGRGTRILMFVRKKDHLLDGIMTSIVDGAGRTLTSSNRRFKYSSLGTAPAAGQFVIGPKPGQRVLPLPPVKLTAPPTGM